MRLQPRRRGLVVFRSSVYPSDTYDVARDGRPAHTGRLRRILRIGVLLTVITVRPRWRPLLAGIAFAAIGFVAREGAGGMLVIPGLLLLWKALLIPGDTDGDRERRTRLRRELGAYSTTAQRRDLEATLDRYPDGVTCEIRDILAGQAVSSHTHGIPGSRAY
jgi:hypothetical protein